MTKGKIAPSLVPIVIAVLVLLLAGGGLARAQTPGAEPGAPAVSPEATGTPAGVAPVVSETPAPTATGLLDEVFGTRVPEPTATPGILAQKVTQLVTRAGLTQTTFLGLRAADWINLGLSVLIVLVGYLLGTLLIRRTLPRLVRRTPTRFDDKLVKASANSLRWLFVILVLRWATIRLTFVSVTLKTVLLDGYFVLALAIGLHVVWKLIDLTDAWYRERLRDEGQLEQLGPVITLLVRVGRVLAGLAGLIVLLSHFGINVSAFAAALGLGGLAFSLAAKDTIADAIAGFIILVDRPFRIGDRIEIQEVGTWGDVVEIGLRTTRIRTRDNRMVIVPNSIIGSSQVINYSYPDPRYRIETHVGIAYGTDIERARRVLVDTVQQVEGVLSDQPVDALYVEMGDSAMIFRVRWWIESYVDTRRMFDKVHTALQGALDAAGIECPYPIQTLHLEVEPETAEWVSGALRGGGGDERGSNPG